MKKNKVATKGILINRRAAMYLMGAGAASLYFAGCTTMGARSVNGKQVSSDWLSQIGPIDRTLGDIAPRAFSGDQPDIPHQILWDKKAYLAKIGELKPTEEADVVIVGGGMSGLMSAYFLKQHKPVILEQAARFGGNSRGESWRGLDYSLATAYFGTPEKGSPIDLFLNEIGVTPMMRSREVNDPVFIDGVRYDDFWEKGTVAESRVQFQKLKKHLIDTVDDLHGQRYPEIPFDNASDQKYVEKLDRMCFKEYIEKVVVKGKLHPHVEAVIETYFWSAAAASSTEMSAAGGLNFFAADFGPIAVTPGGNGAIAEAILKKLSETMPTSNFRAGSLVFDVRVTEKGVLVSSVNAGKVSTILAKSVVMSCPKFVVGRILEGIEPERKKVIDTLRYRSYMLANVMIDHPLKDNFCDYFFLKKDEINTRDVRGSAQKKRISDVVYGNFAKPNQPQTILTFFRGFPYDTARHEIYVPNAYEIYRKEFEDQIRGEAMTMLGLTPDKIVDIRIARWGHPLPLAEKGTLSSRKQVWLRKPFKNRVFFVEQDNWMLPAFETCFAEAETFCPMVSKLLKV